MTGNPDTSTFDIAAMQAHAGEAAQLLKALANEKRLQILCLLTAGERSVGDINALLDLSQSALSQHLAVLRNEGLVTTRRDAQTIYYSCAAESVLKVLDTLKDIYGENDDSAQPLKQLRA